jgi:hypothetical protein
MEIKMSGPSIDSIYEHLEDPEVVPHCPDRDPYS